MDDRVDAFNRMTQEALSSVPPVYTRSIALTRAERADWAGKNASPTANWVAVEVAGRSLRSRLFPVPGATSLCLHVHGGGWVLGAPDHQDSLLATIASESRASVLSVEYRLAPEHPFPAGLEDVVTVLGSVLDGAIEAAVADRIVVMGESAGANLLIPALVRLKGHSHFSRIRGACLNYGTYDLTGSPSLRKAGPSSPLLNAELASWFCTQYTGQAWCEHPEVSPMHASVEELAGLPPAQFLVGSADAVMDDSVLMEERWRMAGNAAELVVIPGGLHGLLEFKTPLTKAAIRLVSDFVRRVGSD